MSKLRVYAIDGIVPVVDPTAYVHPSAVLIGDVIIGPGCYVGPCASLRGDFGRLILEAGANLQDNLRALGSSLGQESYSSDQATELGWAVAKVLAMARNANLDRVAFVRK